MSTHKFYITTPIYYVTAKPHLGSLYSTLLADVLTRWHKLQGTKVFFLTGTDEHGQKVAQAAAQAGMQPKAFVDSFIPAFKDAWHTYEIDYSYFIRTTDANHMHGSQHLVKLLLDQGDIYQSRYHGWYCTPCETFVVEKDDAHGEQGPACPTCMRATVLVSEESYFFKLSAYQDKLLQFYKNNPDFIVPRERLNEVISFVESGLKDLSVSRTTVKWGVPFPGDAQHTIYVWVEALCNYLTGVGYAQLAKAKEFHQWWPADMHIVGKDIIRFHAVYWPALLMAAKLALPKRILVHGWIKIDKQKMSKSLGNVVDPMVLQEHYGVEPVRYYLVRHMAINQDGDFAIEDLEKIIESDLANDLGNLLQRMIALAEKNNVLELAVPARWSEPSLSLREQAWNMLKDVEQQMADCMFHLALARIWRFIQQINAYFHNQEPWKKAKLEQELFLEILSATAHSLKMVSFLLWPIMPTKMEELLSSLGIAMVLEPELNLLEELKVNSWHERFVLKKIPVLFQKPEKEEKTEEKAQLETIEKTNAITIDDFTKIELLVGTIEQCQAVPESDKLLKLQVNFGERGKRQVLSGVRKHFEPSQLIGKQGIFVFNLQPRKMLGMESQGMMLLADNGKGKLQLVTTEYPVPNGTRLK